MANGLQTFASGVYWLDISNHFREWSVLGSVGVILATWLAFRRHAWLEAASALAIVAALFAWPGVEAVVEGRGKIQGERLTVVTFNRLGGNKSSASLRWLSAIQPDLIGFQESDSEWRQRIEFSGLSEMQRVATKRGDVELLSSRSFVDSKEFSAPGRRGIATGIIELGGRTICVASIHPNTAQTRESWTARNRDLDVASFWLMAHCPPSAERIVMGDWNTTPWSGSFRRFLRQNDLVWANASPLPPPTRLLPPPWDWLGAPIDHIAVSAGLKAENCRLGPGAGSDHRPVVCEIGLRKGHSRSRG